MNSPYYRLVCFLQNVRESKVYGEIDFTLDNKKVVMFCDRTILIELLFHEYYIIPFKVRFLDQNVYGFKTKVLYNSYSFGCVGAIRNLHQLIDGDSKLLLDIDTRPNQNRVVDFYKVSNTNIVVLSKSTDFINPFFEKYKFCPINIGVSPVRCNGSDIFMLDYDMFGGCDANN